MSVQIAVRLPPELVRAVDELVERGRYPSRAAMVRAALDAAVEAERARAIDEAIVEGYRRHPPTSGERRWVEHTGRELIAEEPW